MKIGKTKKTMWIVLTLVSAVLIALTVTLSVVLTKERTFQVMFETNGGTVVSSDKYHVIETSPDIRRDGYVLKDWYTSPDFLEETKVTFPYEVKEETTLYAKWAKIYTVTFFNGENVHCTRDVEEGCYAERPADPTKASSQDCAYHFAGWYASETGGEEYAFGTTAVTSDFALYARYTVNPIFTITYRSGQTIFTIGKAENGTKVSAPSETPTKPSTAEYTYAFEGWYAQETGGTAYDFTNTTVTGNLTLYARFTATLRTYNVTFVIDGQSGTPEAYDYGEKVTKPTDPTKASTAEYTYAFEGWYAQETGGTAYDFANTTVTGNLTLYARFAATLRTYNVTFVIDGQSGTPEAYDYGEKVTKPADPTKASTAEYAYAFEGWYAQETGGTAYDFANTTVTGNLTLYARFTATLRSYNVTFVIDGQSGTPEAYDYGEKVTKPTDPTKASTAEYTYAFEGWYAQETGGTAYDFTNTTVTGNLTLYARFAATLRTYNVTFVIDGQSGTPEAYDYGEKVTKPADPTKASTAEYAYAFEGWYAQETGGTAYDFANTTVTGNLTLYARFSQSDLLIFESDGADGQKLVGIKDKKAKTVAVPSRYKEQEVTTVASGALNGCDQLQELSIPFVGEFKDGSGMNTVIGFLFGGKYNTAPDTIIPVSLKTVHVTDGTKLSNYAFARWTGLTAITLPGTLTSIPSGLSAGTFNACTGLKSIEVDPSNTVYYSKDNCILDKSTDTVIVGCSGSTIPDGAKAIEGSAFLGITLESVMIPASVTSIASSAFQQCAVNRISVDPLNTVYYSEENCLIERTSEVLILGTSLSVIPNQVRQIGSKAFASATGLTSITIPSGVTQIGASAFSGLPLTSVTIPASVTVMGHGVFTYCDKLQTVYCEAAAQPEGWSSTWNYGLSATIYWGQTQPV